MEGTDFVTKRVNTSQTVLFVFWVFFFYFFDFTFSAEILGIYKPGYHVLSGEQMDSLEPREIENVIERVSARPSYVTIL